MRADTQSLRNLRNRLTSINNLMHRITLEIVTKLGFAHNGLLASLLGKKVSTILGAIHVMSLQMLQVSVIYSRSSDRSFASKWVAAALSVVVS
jgi:hypothetical protein